MDNLIYLLGDGACGFLHGIGMNYAYEGYCHLPSDHWDMGMKVFWLALILIVATIFKPRGKKASQVKE